MALLPRLLQFLLLIGLLGGVGSQAWSAETPVTLQLRWKHSFQFAGYYAALEKGYYREAGLDVSILEGGPGVDVVGEVVSGRAHFGINNTSLLTHFEKGKPVLLLAPVFQHSAKALMAHGHLQSPEDLIGAGPIVISRTTADDTVVLTAIFRQAGIPMDRLELVQETGPDVLERFVLGHFAAMPVYVSDQPFIMQNLGVSYHLLQPRQYGLDFYGDTLFTHQDLQSSQPEVVEKFRQASLRGWKYALQHPREITQLIHKHYNSQNLSLRHLEYESRVTLELVDPLLVEVGHSNPDRWSRIMEAYAQAGVLKSADPAPFAPLFYHPPTTYNLQKILSIALPALGIAAMFALFAAVVYRKNGQLGSTLAQSRIIQEALRKSEQRQSVLFERNPAAVVVWNEALQVIDWNAAATRMFGWTRDEALGRPLVDLVAPQPQRPAFEQMLRQLLSGQANNQSVDECCNKDGQRLIIQCFNAEIPTLPGQAREIISLLMDITAQHAAEQEVRRARADAEETRESITRLFNASSAGHMILNEQFQIMWANTTMAQLFGFGEVAELLRKRPSELSPECQPDGEASLEKSRRMMALATQTGRHTFDWMHLDTLGHPLPMEVTMVPVHYQGQSCWMCINHDLRPRVEAENDLKAAKEQAEQANRAKSEFLSSMSHELRTPLNAILGFTSLMLLDERLAPDQQQDLNEVNQAGHHLLRLVNEILDLAKIESGKLELSLEPVALPSLLRQCLNLVQPLADQRQVRIEAQIAPDTQALADPVRLRQIVLNLLSNAIKYNHPGGQVTLACAPDTDIEGGGVCITVRDTGPGIAPEHQSTLFHSFQRGAAKDSGIEGTGIGLAITQKLVEAMQGTIGFESTLGEGSTFWVELPTATPVPEAPEDSAPANAPTTEPTSETLPGLAPQQTVVIIDDNPSNLRLISKLLQHQGQFQILTAHRPRAGLALIEKHRPDLVLLDIQMPDMDGYEVLRRMRAQPALAGIPVVAVTANAMASDVERGLAAGFNTYLTKPLNVAEFRRVLGDFLSMAPAA